MNNVIQPSAPTLHLDILVYPKDGYWVAFCLQLDLITATDSREQILVDARRLCLAHVAYAMKNDRLEDLIRPFDPHLYTVLLKARDQAELTLNFVQKNTTEMQAVQIQSVHTATEPQYAKAA
jgi:hypothetical protein